MKQIIKYKCERCRREYDKDGECGYCVRDDRIRKVFSNPNHTLQDVVNTCHKYEYSIKMAYCRASELGL